MERFYSRTAVRILFPLILAVFPLVKMAYGVDLADTGYSLGNYRFFPAAEGTWVLNTYLSQVTGYLFTLLPFGKLMLGMKFYTSLFVSLMALIGYRFFRTKMPAWVAFLGELAAIGLCWCPTVILYNYMTYFFFLLGAILLFRGLAGEHAVCLVLAGVCLGINVLVRNPNVMEAALIVCVWYYGYIRRKEMRAVVRETLYCMAGYVGAVAVMLLIMVIHYGIQAPVDMISGLTGVAGHAEDYALSQMLAAIIDAYLHGMRWLLYMILCILPGIPFFMIRRDKFPRIRKAVYCLAILFLFAVLERWGMYNFRYYQKEAALQWAVIFVILSLVNMIWMLYTKKTDVHWKLIAMTGIVIILVTPLGSNNHVWPIINNLFFVAPITLWMIVKFTIWGQKYIGSESTLIPLFPLKAMQLAIAAALLVQSIGVGGLYVFNDGETGELKNTRITQNTVARGMVTTRANAVHLEEISVFLAEHPEWAERKLILYGDIPALSYYLDRETAIGSAWPDLDSESIGKLEENLSRLTGRMTENRNERPLIIFNVKMDAEKQDSPKKAMLDGFIGDNQYQEVFQNEQFIVYV